MDRDSDQMLIVKANIRKPSNFVIQSMTMDFGVCLINETRSTQEIVISNTSQKQTRTFEVRVDFHSLKFKRFIPEINFDVVDEAEEEYFEEIPQLKDEASSLEIGVVLQKKRRKRPMMMLSKEMEEEIEHMQQKVKIAERKGRKDKAKKLLEKIEKLRSGVSTDDYGAEKEKKETEVVLKNGTLPNNKVESPETADLLMGDSGGGFGGGGGDSGSLNNSLNSEAIDAVITSTESEEVGAAKDLLISSGGPSSSPALRATPTLKTIPSSVAPSLNSTTTVKYRKTDNAIIFTLEPRQIRTVVVTFRALEIRPNLDGLPPDAPGNPLLSLALESLCNDVDDSSSMMESCSGRILVHELKNTDVVKQV
jgi:hypothetical protein